MSKKFEPLEIGRIFADSDDVFAAVDEVMRREIDKMTSLDEKVSICFSILHGLNRSLIAPLAFLLIYRGYKSVEAVDEASRIVDEQIRSLMNSLGEITGDEDVPNA